MHRCQHSFKKIPSNLWVVRVGSNSFQEISYAGKPQVVSSQIYGFTVLEFYAEIDKVLTCCYREMSLEKCILYFPFFINVIDSEPTLTHFTFYGNIENFLANTLP
jgi:hypothetical protein